MQPVSPSDIQTVKTCKHWAQCSVTAAGTAQCACIPGTSGARCENGPCEKTPCLNSGTCLVMGIHATNNIGWEDVIGLGSKILYFRLNFVFPVKFCISGFYSVHFRFWKFGSFKAHHDPNWQELGYKCQCIDGWFGSIGETNLTKNALGIVSSYESHNMSHIIWLIS